MPGIVWQTRPVMLEGLDAKSDPKNVLDGRLLTLENGVWTRPGAINKRADLHTVYGVPTSVTSSVEAAGQHGVSWAKDTTASSACYRLFAAGVELLHLDGRRLRTTRDGTNWSDKGPLVPLSVKVEKLATPPLYGAGGVYHIDACYDGTYLTVAGFTYPNAARLWIATFRYSTGELCNYYMLVENVYPAGVRVVRAGTSILVFFLNTSHALRCGIVNTAAPYADPTFSTPVAANVREYSGIPSLDACSSAVGTTAFVAYVDYTGSDTVYLIEVNAAGGVITGPTNAGAGTSNLAICTTVAGDLLVAKYNPTSIYARLYTSAFVAASASTTVVAAPGSLRPVWCIETPWTADKMLLLCSGDGAAATAGAYKQEVSALRTLAKPANPANPLTIATPTTTAPDNLYAITRPWVRDAKVLWGASYEMAKRPAYDADIDGELWTPYGLVIEYTESASTAVARFLEGQIDNAGGYQCVRPCVIGADQIELLVPGVFASGGVSNPDLTLPTPVVTRIRLGVLASSVAKLQALQHGEAVVLTGGFLHEWDGRNLTEAMLHAGPDNVFAEADYGGGSLPGADTQDPGEYQIAQVFVWRGVNGRLYKSAPSNKKTITLASTGRIYVYQSSPPVSFKVWGEVKIITYMSQCNGSVLYEVNNQVPVESLTPLVLAAQPAGTEPKLYTTGGILPHYPPPACWNVCTRGNRLFAACNDGHVHFTKELVDGESAAQFCDEFVKVRPGADSEPFYVAEMGGNVFAFYKKGIAVFGGPGPGDTGLGDFTDFQEIATDTKGYTDYAGAVPAKTDAGLFFWTDKGPALLNQQLQVEPIGLAIETLASGLTCLDIVALPNRFQVWFLTAAKVFVFDYLLKRWSTFPLSYTAVGMVEIDNVVYIAGSDGKVYKELASTFKTTDILKFRTGWIRPQNYMGEFNVRKMLLLGTKKSAATLTVKVYFDYSDTAAETHTLAITTPWASEPAELVVPLDRQRCQAVSFEVYDGGLSGTNEGVTISGMHLEVGLKPDRIVKVPGSKITS